MAEALREACASGNLKAVEYYLSQGINVNSQNKVNGFSPLHWANSRGHEDIIKLLVMNGADQNLKDSKGRIPADLYNPKPFQEGGFVPNYIASPDITKLWGTPTNDSPAPQVVNIVAPVVESSDDVLARVVSEKAEIHPAATINGQPSREIVERSDSMSTSNMSSMSRKVSFKGDLTDDENKLASAALVSEVVASEETVAMPRTASPERDRSRSNSVDWDDSKRSTTSKRSSSMQRSVSFLDRDVTDGTPSAATTMIDASNAITKVQTSAKKPLIDDFIEPSKTIDGTILRSSSKPLNPIMPVPSADEKISLRGSIFISSETTLLGLHNQLLQEIDDMPQDFILQKERDGLYIPINRHQLTQSAAVHFRNSNLIFTSDPLRSNI